MGKLLEGEQAEVDRTARVALRSISPSSDRKSPSTSEKRPRPPQLGDQLTFRLTLEPEQLALFLPESE